MLPPTHWNTWHHREPSQLLTRVFRLTALLKDQLGHHQLCETSRPKSPISQPAIRSYFRSKVWNRGDQHKGADWKNTEKPRHGLMGRSLRVAASMISLLLALSKPRTCTWKATSWGELKIEPRGTETSPRIQRSNEYPGSNYLQSTSMVANPWEETFRSCWIGVI